MDECKPLVVGEALRTHPRGAHVLVSTKAGMRRAGPASRDWRTGSVEPGALRAAAEASHAALGGHRAIDLW